MDDWIVWVILAMSIASFASFLTVILWAIRTVKPLLSSFTNESGEFELPHISIKQAIAYGIVKLIEGADFTKILGGFGKK